MPKLKMTSNELFIRNVKIAMQMAGLSRSQLAKRMNCSEATIHHWLNPNCKDTLDRVNIRKLQQLCTILRTTADELLYGDWRVEVEKNG